MDDQNTKKSTTKVNDQAIADLIIAEEKRQRDGLELIPSENYVSREVLNALGSVYTNKYSRAILEGATMAARKTPTKLSKSPLIAPRHCLAPITPTYSRILAHQPTSRCIRPGWSPATPYWP